MIKYENTENNKEYHIKSHKEYLKRKNSLVKFRKELKKQIELNEKRRQLSLEYSKKYISD